MNFTHVLCLLYIWNLPRSALHHPASLCMIVLSYEPSIFLTFLSLFHYIPPLMCRTDSGRLNILLMSSDRTMTNCLYIVFSGCYEMISFWLTKQTRCWFFFYCISDCFGRQFDWYVCVWSFYMWAIFPNGMASPAQSACVLLLPT